MAKTVHGLSRRSEVGVEDSPTTSSAAFVKAAVALQDIELIASNQFLQSPTNGLRAQQLRANDTSGGDVPCGVEVGGGELLIGGFYPVE